MLLRIAVGFSQRSAIPLATLGLQPTHQTQFIRQNRIHIAGTEAFLKPELNHNRILILDLTETIRVGRGRNPVPGWKPDPRESLDR